MMNNNVLSKITRFFLYAVPFSAVIVSRGTLFPFIVGKYVFFRTAVGLALIFFLWQWALSNKIFNFQFSIFKNLLVVAVSVFALIYIISGFFGYNPSFSFWSNFERGEGGLQMIFLLIYFLLLVAVFRDEESWKKMLVAAVWAMILVVGYGVDAALGIDKLVGGGFCERFAGSLGNSAYLGTYMLFAIFYALYLLVDKIKNKKITLVTSYYLLIPIFFLIFLLLSQTRGAFLGLGVAIVSGLFYLFFNSSASKKIRLFSLFFAAVLIIGGSLAIKYRDSVSLSMPFCGEKGTRLLDVSLNTQNMQTRLLLWKQSIAIFKEKPVFGWGMENFNVPFEKKYDPYFKVWYDRAHNIFFDYLTMTGLLGLLSFIGIFIVYYRQFFKARTNTDYTQTNTDKKYNEPELLYEDLTYKIRGIIFKVKKELGLGHKENIYQKAIENEFKNNNLIFEKEKSIDIKYGDEKIGVYRPDFIIDNKIILELKALPLIGKFEKQQVWHYLKGSDYKLALLVNFGRKDIEIERFIYDGRHKLISSSQESVSGRYKSVFSLYESALLFALPIAYLVQGLVLFDVLPVYINLFLFLAFANYKLKEKF